MFFTVRQRLGAVGWRQSEGALSKWDKWRGQNDARELFFLAAHRAFLLAADAFPIGEQTDCCKKHENHNVG